MRCPSSEEDLARSEVTYDHDPEQQEQQPEWESIGGKKEMEELKKSA